MKSLESKLHQRAIVLVSGGMDSLVTAAVAADQCKELFFLHVNYGQLTEERELAAFEAISTHYRPQKCMISSIEYLKQIGNTSLIDKRIEMESISTETTGVPNTYVPFRNAHLLAIAVSWGEAVSADRIYIGVVEEDSAGYPDCRESFINSYNEMIRYGTSNSTMLKVEAPLIHKTKQEIVRLGSQLDVPFELSWSCYKDNELACGECSSCRLRLKGFREAGLEDPLPYRNKGLS